MASLRGSNRRVAEAQERINLAAAQVVDRFGIVVGSIPVYRRNPHRQAAEQSEWMADVLEKLAELGAGGVIDLVNPSDQADEGANFDEPQGTPLAKMKRVELEEMAVLAGMSAEDAKKAKNIDALVAFIEEQTAPVEDQGKEEGE